MPPTVRGSQPPHRAPTITRRGRPPISPAGLTTGNPDAGYNADPAPYTCNDAAFSRLHSEHSGLPAAGRAPPAATFDYCM
ncbi:hypothetical protein FRACA_120016 [Frankia canadensis]|uniref:Uncharacterized protein n=1 Tax=Frankia canadensis TaxID=1836972 RepID=A0A2I2KJW2_9ACTN|nr:hypothetical protein FRACA_120016 [Frankia canadensis]SOU53243.1 hypothetical protein FRACA_120016 [Frankia canadensis]